MNPHENPLLLQCTHFLSGHKRRPSHEVFSEIAEYCQHNKVTADYYGSGKLIGAFEKQIADLLGKEAAVFMPSGVMAQLIAARIWSDRAGVHRIGLHETSHLEVDEEHAYSHLHALQATFLGEKSRLFTAADIEHQTEKLSTILLELPYRYLGGRLPSWDELQAIKQATRDKDIRLHMDGARLWESQPFYGKSHAEICQDFDSVYVSFYKGIGAITGSMLCGPRDFINEARIWLRRHGGNLFQLTPYVVSAKIGFEQRISKFAQYCARARTIAQALNSIEGVRIQPTAPQTSMMHILLNAAPEALLLRRDLIAEEDHLWLATHIKASDVPGWSYFEIAVGDATLELSDEQIVSAVKRVRLPYHP